MNTAQKVFHLLRKDWQRTSWLFLAFCVALGVTTVSALADARRELCAQYSDCNVEISFGLQLLCGLLATLFVGTVIQDDSPTDHTAFWRAQPVSSLAVLGGKLVYGLLLPLAFVATAQLLSLTANGLPFAGALYTTGVGVYWTCSFLMVCMLGAIVTQGIQAFLVTMAMVAIVRTVAFSGFLQYFGFTPSVDTPSFRGDVWVISALAVFAWAYLGNNRRKQVRIAAIALPLLVLTVGWDHGDYRGVRFLTVPVKPPAPDLPAIAISVTEHDSSYVFRFETAAPTGGHRYALRCGDIALKFPSKEWWSPWQSPCYPGRRVPPVFVRDSTIAGAGTVFFSFTLAKYSEHGRPLPVSATAWTFDALLEEQEEEFVADLPVQLDGDVTNRERRFQSVVTDVDTGGRTLRRVYVTVTEATEPIAFVQRESANTSRFPAIFAPQGVSKLSESAFELRVVERATTGPLTHWATPTELLWDRIPLVLPAPEVVRKRQQVNSECQPSCVPEWWVNKHVLISRWKHVSYVPVHAEGRVPHGSPVPVQMTKSLAR